MVSRFFHVYGKLHKAVFVLNFVLNYKFFAISFISGRCLVTPRRCRPPWCHPKKSYLHCLIGKAGRYPIEYHNTRIMKAISKEVAFIISPFLIRLYRRSSYLRYNQYKHCGFVSIKLQHDCLGVTQTTVTCLNW